ncbi:MAG: hypothetical protein ACOX2F_01690 [bacterium]
MLKSKIIVEAWQKRYSFSSIFFWSLVAMEIPLLYRAFTPIIKSEIEKVFSEM